MLPPFGGPIDIARPRKLTSQLEASGAFIKDPQRRRPPNMISNQPIGDPPEWLSDEECAIWFDLVADIPEGELTRPDRYALALLAQLQGRAQRDELTGVERGQLIKMFALFGMSPSDRSRVLAPTKNDETSNPFAEFSAT